MNDKELLRSVMRRQAGLSLRVAAVFLGIIFVLPLVNLYAPELAATNVGGFSLTWLILAVLFYPITWGLSAYFIKRSNALEDAIVQEQEKLPREAGAGGANR
ncbi:MAG: DUF485 domain-containing protein [Armatimonadetes bacterium]|nr:DUF485 domain-containing protein [Armatimonadota bacterium]